MITKSARASRPSDLLRRAWASNRPLAFVGATMLLVLAVCLAGLLLDSRVITGAPAWLKPMKFATSISIYCFTLLWMLTFVRVATVTRTAARLALAGAAMFLVLLAALHFIKPEVDPSWQMMSKYEIGRHGWVMVLAFLSLASSCIALSVAVRSQVRTVGGKVGLALLLVSAAGMTIAAVFTTDPITASQDELTTHGKLHGVGFILGIPSFPVAAALISQSLARNRAWSPARRALLWAVALPWVGLLGFVLSVAFLLSRGNGEFGPDVPIGWPNRFVMVAYSAWLMAVAWQAIQTRGQGF